MIRHAAPEDLAAIVALTEAAYAPYDAVLDAPTVPVTEDYVPRIAAGQVWLLEDAAGAAGAPRGPIMPAGPIVPAGLIVLERHPDHVLIFSVAVAPSRQGEGLGRRLLAWAEAQARAGGVAEVRLYTNAKMTRNIALYARCGYRETGRRGHPARKDWVRVDMAKTLGETPA
ncbi:MAG: GNAT family N-acetyltransferase [Acetobacteraceae bacterium]